MQQKYWDGEERIMLPEESQKITECLSEKLRLIRVELQEKLQTLDLIQKFQLALQPNQNDDRLEREFYREIKSISLWCTDQMVAFSEQVFEKSVNTLKQEPPCSFSVIALGSLAKGEATPYSDLEYIFLVEKKDPSIEEYFQKLALTSYFIIGNLQETPLNTMAIAELEGWFDDKQMNGFKIDGLEQKAGNIPTGNGIDLSSTKYILQPTELADLYREKLLNPKEDSDRGDFTAMVHWVRVIFSHKESKRGFLLDQFLEHKKKPRENTQRQKANEKMFKKDVEVYNFLPDYQLIRNGYLINAKKQLYRYPSIMLHDISILSGLSESSSWDTLSSLNENKVISSSIYDSLSFLLACSCYIRLDSYRYYGAHDDRMSVLKDSEVLNFEGLVGKTITLDVGKRYYINESLFVRYCEHSIPLKNHMAQNNTAGALELVKSQIKKLPAWLLRFQTHHCCHRWSNAWEVFENWQTERGIDADQPCETTIQLLKAEVNNNFEMLWFCVKAIGYSLLQKKMYVSAEKYYQCFEKEISKLSQDSNKEIHADMLEEYGIVCIYLNKLQESEQKFQKSLDIRSQIFDRDHELVARSTISLARSFMLQKKCDKGEQCLWKNLKIYHLKATGQQGALIQISDDSLELASEDVYQLTNLPPSVLVLLSEIIWSLGHHTFYLKLYDRAFTYFKLAMGICQEAFGDKACSKDSAQCLFGLAFSSDATLRHQDAEEYFRRALSVIIQVFSSDSAPADTNADTFSWESAIWSFRALPGYKEDNVETAACARYLGLHLIYEKKYELAHQLLEITKTMYKEATNGKTDVEEDAKTLSIVGFNYWKEGNKSEAVNQFLAALECLSGDTSSYGKMEAAETRQKLGLLYQEDGEHEKARDCYEQALKIYENVCKDQKIDEHPKIRETREQIESL